MKDASNVTRQPVRLAKEVVFSRATGTPTMTIDGEPFPFYLAETPRIAKCADTGMYTVTVELLVDNVLVDLSLSEESNAAIEASLKRVPLDKP